ncbi:MAG TPA: DUF4178 domain-containing protein, partial [Blastocatellia bacterium]|nr:DUF4178 domain-containing protein [Blastocatellia bacterium]
ELTGRAQLGHQAGGVWDEWYAAFKDGRWGWLAEAQGRFYITFEVSLPPDEGKLPAFDEIQIGQAVTSIPGAVAMVAAETGEARALGAKGEIPYRLVPGQTYFYADLSGPHGEFATIDYGDGERNLYMGREVQLAELGFAASVHAPEHETRHAGGVQLNCPKCGGPMDLRAPDKTERVTCPNCGSLLDVNQGGLVFLKALERGRVVPVIPIGTTGDIAGGKYTVIGFMQRSVEFSGVRYHWEEYLLYNPQLGFRWLVRSDEQWNFVETVSPGQVKASAKYATFNNRHFRIYQDTVARVDYVSGEFYWKVTLGELVRASDFVHPPFMLSREISVTEAQRLEGHGGEHSGTHRTHETGEINWSLGTYVTPKTVEKAFGISGLPKPGKPAPNQEFPHKKVYSYWGLTMLVALVLGLIVGTAAPERTVFQQTYTLEPLANGSATQTIFTDPIQLKSSLNIQVTATASIDNSWLFVDGDFYDNSNGLTQAYELPVEYYYGSDSDGPWREGSPSASAHISALPSGSYVMRMEIQWEHWNSPMNMTVRVEQGVARTSHLGFTLLALSILPFLVLIQHYVFSVRRWADSEFTPFKGG